MKINKKYLQTLIFICVYLFGIYFWSQPYQERKLPYGEFDALSHFEVADYMSYNDKSFIDLPPYIDIRYGYDNIFKPHTLWYPPTFHASLGVMETISGERVLPVFLMNTVLATFILISVYFVINSLFGFTPAILSSILLIFSPRDILPFLWGQWPERFGYAFVPIVLYCFYKYLIYYKKEESKPIYFYLTSLFLALNLLVHPMTFFHSVFALIVLYIFLFIKSKKFIFNWKHSSIFILIFLIIFMLFPYQTFRIFPELGFGKENTNPPHEPDFSRLFQWSMNPDDFKGSVPALYFDFEKMHGFWTLPFMLLGILILLLSRKNRDLFLLAWLVSLYIVLHRDLFGKLDFLHRSLSATAHIFIPLTAIGILGISSLFRLPKKHSNYLKLLLAGLFIYFTFTVNMAEASTYIGKESFNPYTTAGFFSVLSHEQFQAAEWVLENVPITHNISVFGLPYQEQFKHGTARKIKWFNAVSQRLVSFLYDFENEEEFNEEHLYKDYVMLDYTMLGPLNDQKSFNKMQEIEKTTLSNHSLLYNQNNIRIFKYES